MVTVITDSMWIPDETVTTTRVPLVTEEPAAANWIRLDESSDEAVEVAYVALYELEKVNRAKFNYRLVSVSEARRKDAKEARLYEVDLGYDETKCAQWEADFDDPKVCKSESQFGFTASCSVAIKVDYETDVPELTSKLCMVPL